MKIINCPWLCFMSRRGKLRLTLIKRKKGVAWGLKPSLRQTILKTSLQELASWQKKQNLMKPRKYSRRILNKSTLARKGQRRSQMTFLPSKMISAKLRKSHQQWRNKKSALHHLSLKALSVYKKRSHLGLKHPQNTKSAPKLQPKKLNCKRCNLKGMKT